MSTTWNGTLWNRTVRFGLLALAAAVAAALVGATPAAAEADNVVETNSGIGGAATTTCSGTLDSGPFDVPNAGDYLFVNMGAKTTRPIRTPTDSQGNTFTLVASSATGGAATGRWVGLWMTRSIGGYDVVSWPCDGRFMSGAAVGTFTATGPKHLLTVDVRGSNAWNGSATETASTSAPTTATNELVLTAGYTRQAVIIRDTGPSSVTYDYVNGIDQSSGTEWDGFNTTAYPTYAPGTVPFDTVNFGAVSRTCNPACTAQPTHGASIIAAFTSS